MTDDDDLKPGEEPDAQPQWHWRLIQIISGGLLLWGTYLAIGAMFNSGERSTLPLLKGLIILVFCAAFVGFWSALLWWREKQQRS
jgi:hypothetical protein